MIGQFRTCRCQATSSIRSCNGCSKRSGARRRREWSPRPQPKGARQKCPTRVLAALRSGYALPPARQHPRHSNRAISDRPRLPPVTFLCEAIRWV